MNSKIHVEQIIIKLILFSGVILSLIQFIYNRSLWFDEAMLALNIINKNSLELLKPLDYFQSSPILFLQIEKIFSYLIPNSEFGLKLFPFISYLLSLFLFYKIIKVIHQNYYTIIFSLSLFVFNITLIYYSSEVKQYMTDAFVLTSVYYLLLKKYKNESYKYYFLCIVGVFSIFLSDATPIILFTTGFYLLFDIYRHKKKHFLQLTVISIAWVISFLLYYFLFVHNNAIKDYLITYWENFGVFMPANPFKSEFYNFLDSKGYMIVSSLFRFDRNGIFLIFFILAGIVSFIRKIRTDIIILTIMPVILHLLLSGFKLYPFDKRLILYICPCVIIFCSFGFNYLTKILLSKLKIESVKLLAISIPLLMFLFFSGKEFPKKLEEIKECINYIQEHIGKNDKIYVYYGATYAFEFYNTIGFFNTLAPIIYGTNNRSENEKYINELIKLNGRNWLLFSHVNENEETYIVGQLDSLGYNKIETYKTKGSSAYLYDFRD